MTVLESNTNSIVLARIQYQENLSEIPLALLFMSLEAISSYNCFTNYKENVIV